MRTLISFVILLFTCASSLAQVNYVINGDLEKYSKCPDVLNKIYYANPWRNVQDSTLEYGVAYYNTCSNSGLDMGLYVPSNSAFFQLPHSGRGMAGAHFFYDKTSPKPSPPLPSNFRHYLQSRLSKKLTAGTSYCVSFYVNLMEASGYAQNKLGAYLDDGSINFATDTPGSERLSLIPQMHTEDVISDTGKWVKIEGLFIATGNEDHITIGNFFPNADVTTIVTYYWPGYKQYTAYLIDDISVIESDHKADAGLDTWVEETKTVKIGPADDTTATAIDCKWYHKGSLIDSGAVITVPAASTKGIIDTYIVVQTICGNVTMDTVLVNTVGLGVHEPSLAQLFTVFPSPSDGNIQIFSRAPKEGLQAVVIDMLGRLIYAAPLEFKGNTTSLKLGASPGIYILSINGQEGNNYREQIIIR